MVTSRKETPHNEAKLTLVTEDEMATRKLGSVAKDLIQFPSTMVERELMGPCIHLYLPDSREPIELLNVARVTLGRIDSYSQQKPMIDLSDHHAKLLGVSRMHAEIVYDNDRYYIRDMNSTNGTWVNDKEVKGDGQIKLVNGDTIRLGHLMIQVGGVS